MPPKLEIDGSIPSGHIVVFVPIAQLEQSRCLRSIRLEVRVLLGTLIRGEPLSVSKVLRKRS